MLRSCIHISSSPCYINIHYDPNPVGQPEPRQAPKRQIILSSSAISSAGTQNPNGRFAASQMRPIFCNDVIVCNDMVRGCRYKCFRYVSFEICFADQQWNQTACAHLLAVWLINLFVYCVRLYIRTYFNVYLKSPSNATDVRRRVAIIQQPTDDEEWFMDAPCTCQDTSSDGGGCAPRGLPSSA